MKNQEPSLGFLITKLGRIVTKMYADRLELLDLTPLQAGVIGTAASAGKCNQRMLIQVLRADKGTVHQTLKSLERKKLIASTPSSEDRRHLDIRLTKAGLALLPEILAIDTEVTEKTRKLVPANLRRGLMDALREMYSQAPLDF